MKEFLKKVIDGNGISPSDVCLNAFNSNFENAINVEWHNRGDYYEAVFYKDMLEHIAMFDLSGSLIEYKLNLPADYLPEPIRKTVEMKGEIMNAVMSNKGNTVDYEVIVKDKEFNRYAIVLSETGNLLAERKL